MAETWTVARLRSWIHSFLAEKSIDSPMVCADLLIAHVLQCDRMRLYMDPERPANAEELAKLRGLVQRAGRHEPVQYLVGTWSFFGCEIEVGPATLIPRPATESLVEEALRLVRNNDGVLRAGEIRIADLCTGSGCVAIAIAKSLLATRGGRKQLSWSKEDAESAVEPLSAAAVVRIVATEIVPEACEMARRNVKSLGLDSAIEILQGDLDAPMIGRDLEGSFDLLCANPPYISDAEWAEVPKNVRDFEPSTALRGGHDGLDFVRRIVSTAPKWLKPSGSILIEISSTQGQSATAIATDHGFRDIRILPDLEGHPRILAAVRPGLL
ncbi:MAG: peptide chain release factor N(5)-glutamine methyltransferase [Planctomycetota bacterium]|nr:peptide chain release factor N(5)-glutamine methyltransferase [Planctomycetota bacterium]